MSTARTGLPAVPERTAQSIGVEVHVGREQLRGIPRKAAFDGGREQLRGIPRKAAFSGGRAAVMIEAGARMPAARVMTFTTVADHQRAIEVRVVRCTADARPSGVVGRFLLSGLRDGLRGEARIDIGLSLDREGVLRVWASERSSGARQEVSFAGLWALEPDLRPDAIASLARRVDAGINAIPAKAQAGLRADRDVAEQWAREGELVHAGGGAGAAARMPQPRQERVGAAARMPQPRQERVGAAADRATALATLAGEIDSRLGREQLRGVPLKAAFTAGAGSLRAQHAGAERSTETGSGARG